MPLDSGGGFVGINANINIKQLPGTPEQSRRLFFLGGRAAGGGVCPAADVQCVTTGTGKQRPVSEILLNGGGGGRGGGGGGRWVGESGELAEDAFWRRGGRE